MCPKRSKPPVPRRGLSFPAPLLDQIKEIIKDKDEYRSVSGYINAAIREKIEGDELKKAMIEHKISEHEFFDTVKKLNLNIPPIVESKKSNYPEPLTSIRPKLSQEDIEKFEKLILYLLTAMKTIEVK